MKPDTSTRRELLTTSTATLATLSLTGCIGGKVSENDKASEEWDTSVSIDKSTLSGDYERYYASGYADNLTDTTYSAVTVHVAFYDSDGNRIDVVESDTVYDVGPDHKVTFTVTSGPYEFSKQWNHPARVEVQHVEADK